MESLVIPRRAAGWHRSGADNELCSVAARWFPGPVAVVVPELIEVFVTAEELEVIRHMVNKCPQDIKNIR
jgi:hypothetical protein